MTTKNEQLEATLTEATVLIGNWCRFFLTITVTRISVVPGMLTLNGAWYSFIHILISYGF